MIKYDYLMIEVGLDVGVFRIELDRAGANGYSWASMIEMAESRWVVMERITEAS
jgi:hypothetical protein